MQPSPLPEIMGALVGSLCGVIITYFAFKLQQKRKIVEYEIFSIPLLRFDPRKNSAIFVSADRFLLTGEESDKGVSSPIDNAYSFNVELVSVGNEPIEKPSIEICLDEKANILKYETEPTFRPGYEITVLMPSTQRNTLLLSPPYLNKGEKLSVRLFSTGNEGTKCNVSVLGVGIRTRKRLVERYLVSVGLFASTIASALICLLLVAAGIKVPLTPLLETLGFYAETRTVILLPPSAIIPILVLFLYGFFIYFKTIRNARRRFLR